MMFCLRYPPICLYNVCCLYRPRPNSQGERNGTSDGSLVHLHCPCLQPLLYTLTETHLIEPVAAHNTLPTQSRHQSNTHQTSSFIHQGVRLTAPCIHPPCIHQGLEGIMLCIPLHSPSKVELDITFWYQNLKDIIVDSKPSVYKKAEAHHGFS